MFYIYSKKEYRLKKRKKTMYLLILFIPLMSAIIAGLFGRFIGEKGASIITTSLIGITS